MSAPQEAFTHTPAAIENRQRKAHRLADVVLGWDVPASRLGDLLERKKREKQAGVPRASDETWQLVLELVAAARRIVCDRCRAGFDGDTAAEAQERYEEHLPHAHPKLTYAGTCYTCTPPVVVDGTSPRVARALLAAHVQREHSGRPRD